MLFGVPWIPFSSPATRKLENFEVLILQCEIFSQFVSERKLGWALAVQSSTFTLRLATKQSQTGTRTPRAQRQSHRK
jgi:hypothetical protein